MSTFDGIYKYVCVCVCVCAFYVQRPVEKKNELGMNTVYYWKKIYFDGCVLTVFSAYENMIYDNM